MNYPTEWNLKPLAPDFSEETIEAKKEEIAERHRAFTEKWKNDDSYLFDPKKMREALDEGRELSARGGVGGDIGYGIGLYAVLDQADPTRRALSNKFVEFEKKLSNEAVFFGLNICKIPKDRQPLFLQAPELEEYRYALKGWFEEGDHLLSEAEEKLETLKAGVSSYKWVDMVEGLVAEETRPVKGEAKTFEELLSLTRNPDKETRDEAAAGVHDITAKYRKVAENEINAVLENKKIEDELRGWPHPESYRLFNDDISKEAVDTMTVVVSDSNLIAQEYYALKAEVLGLPKLAYHERNLPIGHTEKKYSYEEGYALTKKVLGNLDPEFAEVLEGFAAGGFIDVYPRKGKRGGAACWHNAITQPTYILLNWTDTIDDVTTLAHEVGHGINNELIKKKQTATYFGTPTSTAEVASTFMEDFVLDELLKDANEEERLAILFNRMDDVVSTIFRQVACYKFEQELHATFREKGYVSADEIGTMFSKHMSAYMGPAVEQSPGSENWWVYWGHIRSYFYVYSYASGLLISMALQAKTRENPAFIGDVKEFLAAGTSDLPENIFMKLGVNIRDRAFWEQGVGQLQSMLNEARELARKLGKAR